MNLVTFIILTLAAYRVGRLIQLDEIFAEPRDKLFGWLMTKNRFTAWLYDGLTCPYCLTVWTAAGGVAYWGLLITEWPGWRYPLYVAAVAAGAVFWWGLIDSED